MPRQSRRSTRTGGHGGAQLSETPAPTERTAVFQKTKMCKFHILGACARGTNCLFAHDEAELNPLPDLSRTKLCKTLIATGRCDDPNCRYAHREEELKESPVGLVDEDGNEIPEDLQTAVPAACPVAAPPTKAKSKPADLKQIQEIWKQQPEQNGGTPEAAPLGWPMGGGVENGQGLMTAATVQMMSEMALQINQAAQAHAAEAARLHAKAEQLQASAVGGVPPELTSAIQDMASRPFAGGLSAYGFDGSAESLAISQTTSGSEGSQHFANGNEQPYFVKNTFINVCDPATVAPGRLRYIHSASGRLDHMGYEDASPAPATASGGFGTIGKADSNTRPAVGEGLGGGMASWSRSQASPTEPLQIHPGSLRSLSNNDLVALGGGHQDEDENGLSQPSAEDLRSGRRAAGQSLLDPARVHTGGFSKLRPIQSVGGRLESLGEEEEPSWLSTSAVHRVLLPRSPRSIWSGQNSSDFPESSEGALCDDVAPSATGGYRKQTADASLTSALPARISRMNLSSWPTAGQAAVASPQLTFAEAKDPPPALRVVRTAAGRLDLMAPQEDEDEI
eukprot:TRINITY_DN2643_c0_g1_i1.p1 TRINITY_DN2643_c0_g1~~TRINITY_DN2643_c0_g1_i1.p1  ORF type:complete len:565 (+),score=108.15 TRINITY_DN2643_c0_g1_i1:168-1862(+)